MRPSNAVDGSPGAPGGGPGGRLGLPCHMSEQLNNGTTSPTPSGGKAQRLARLRVELEIQGLCVRYGVNRIGFLTLTFADDVKTLAEAQRRLNSVMTNQLSKRYVEWVCVAQRHKDNRIHFHLVVVMAQDIRTGFDFAAVARRDYSSASPYLKAEWAFLRAVLPYDEQTGKGYSFGRHELLPVRIADGFGRYVARYVGRAGNTRQDEKGARLVRFSRGFKRCVVGKFSKVDAIEERARNRLPEIVDLLGFRDIAHLECSIGPRWKYHFARLLYCREEIFYPVLLEARRSLLLYGGRMLALEEAFTWWDEEKAPALSLSAEIRELWNAHEEQRHCQGAGVKGTPERSDTEVPTVAIA